MREKFIDWNPHHKSRDLLQIIDAILWEYGEQGYRLTLRQLYYQLVARDLIPNTVAEYNKVGNLVSKARLAGYIDWDMIEDRVRIHQSNTHWESPAEILESASENYYKDRWINQDNYIEVWVEKDALSGIIEPICSEHDVTFMANKGYSSSSAMYQASKRFIRELAEKETRIIYLGDHDPSGLDMVRDIQERMSLFLFGSSYSEFPVEQVALNMEQIVEHNLPPNPAKITDSRYGGYVFKYGENSWELDALDPKVLSGIVTDAINQYIDWDKFNGIEEEETEEKEKLMNFVNQL